MRDTLSIGMLMNRPEERGPPCDRNKAFCGSVRVLSNRAKLLASTLRAAWDCQPALRNAETSLVATSSQLGHTKPSASTLRWQIQTARWEPHVLCGWLGGCRSAIIWKASAQLAQCLNLTALLRLSPPMAKGRFAAALANKQWLPDPTNQHTKTPPDLCVMLGGECVGQRG